MPKFFVSPAGISGQTIKICGLDAKHLIKVLRKSVGDDIIVCDGCGFDYHGTIREISGTQEVLLDIREKCKNLCEPEVKVTLYQCVPKGSKMDEVVQKCTELGVSAIVPFLSARTVVRDDAEGFSKKQLRWQKTADEAVKQCMRGVIPQVGQTLSFSEMLRHATEHSFCIMPYEECDTPGLKEALLSAPSDCRDVGIIIGSEGGFEQAEVEQAQSMGILPVTLGNRILRTETAGAAVLGCVMYQMDQMKKNKGV